jgi:hypothetical protein
MPCVSRSRNRPGGATWQDRNARRLRRVWWKWLHIAADGERPFSEARENMSFVVQDNDKVRELCPPGSYSAVCVDVVDLGVVESAYKGQIKKQHKCRILFEVAEQRQDGSPFYIGERFTASLGEKATLRKFLEGWRGKAFTADELKGFDLEQLIGAPAIISVVHNQNGDKTYDNIASASKLMKGMPALKPNPKYVRVKDRPTTQPNGSPMPQSFTPEPDETQAQEEEEALPF